MTLQLILVLAVKLLIRDVQIQCDLLVVLKLHNQEWVPGLALSERRIQPDTEHAVHLVRLGEDHKLLDMVVLDLVIVCLATETERRVVHIDIETSSEGESVSKPRKP